MRKTKREIVNRLLQFMGDEAMSCSMDYGCNTPQYVYRMWGGEVPLKEIEETLAELNKER